MEPVRALANKLAEHAARLAGVIALVDDLHRPMLSGGDMAAGVELAQHYIGEALRLYAAGASDPGLIVAEKTLFWMQTGWEGNLISLPDIYQRGPGMIRDAKSAKRIVAVLEEHGWLHRLSDGAFINGERRRDAWQIVGAQS